MTAIRKLAIVGRPNVGKSALFNRIIGKRLSIVDEAEGVTRDRLLAKGELFGIPFGILDTGGINPHSEVAFNKEIREQSLIAIDEADGLILVVDGTIGLTDLDEQLARQLKKTKKPLVLAVNKADSKEKENLVADFYRLGIKDMFPVSALHNLNIVELLQSVLEQTTPKEEPPLESCLRVALIGKPNAGKSTLLNHLLQEPRCIVSPIPGTTRDSIDVQVTSPQGKLYTFVDTAGIRKKQAERDVVDKFAALRTQKAIDRADVIILLFDANEGITSQERKFTSMIQESGKPCLIFFNKWDLVKDYRMEHCLKRFRVDEPFLQHCPTLFGSALTGRNLDKLFDKVDEVAAEASKRITTGELNKFLTKQLQLNPPPVILNKRLRIYYATQIKTTPPSFTLFVNYRHLMTKTYQRFLQNRFREEFGFYGAPIFFYMKEKKNHTYEKNEQMLKQQKEKQAESIKVTKEEEFKEFEWDDFGEESLATLDPADYEDDYLS